MYSVVGGGGRDGGWGVDGAGRSGPGGPRFGRSPQIHAIAPRFAKIHHIPCSQLHRIIYNLLCCIWNGRSRTPIPRPGPVVTVACMYNSMAIIAIISVVIMIVSSGRLTIGPQPSTQNLCAPVSLSSSCPSFLSFFPPAPLGIETRMYSMYVCIYIASSRFANFL